MQESDLFAMQFRQSKARHEAANRRPAEAKTTNGGSTLESARLVDAWLMLPDSVRHAGRAAVFYLCELRIPSITAQQLARIAFRRCIGAESRSPFRELLLAY